MGSLIERTASLGHATHAVQAMHAVADGGQGSRFNDYLALMKPRVMSLVVFTGGVGLVAAPGALDAAAAIVTLVLMAAGAGACGALNM